MNSTDGAPNVTFDLASTNGAPPNATFDLHSNLTDSTRQTIDCLYTAAYVINFLLGLPTNSYVLWLIVTGAGGGVASEIFALNLSVSEIIYCLSAVLHLLYMYRFPAVKDLYLFFGYLLSTGRSLFQCCICVERYLAVLRPVVFLKCRPLRYRVALSAWVVMLAYSLVLIFTPQESIYYFLLALYLVVLSVQLFCCLAVLRALKRPGPGDRGREREGGGNHVKERAFRIILILLVSMVVGYTPMITASLMIRLIPPVQLGVFRLVSFCITLVTGFVQPMLYLHRAGKLPFIRAA